MRLHPCIGAYPDDADESKLDRTAGTNIAPHSQKVVRMNLFIKEMLEHQCDSYPTGIAICATTVARVAPMLIRRVLLRMNSAQLDSGNGDSERDDQELDSLVLGYIDIVNDVLNTAAKRKDMTEAQKTRQDQMEQVSDLQRDQALRGMEHGTDGPRKKRISASKRASSARSERDIDLSSDVSGDGTPDDDDGIGSMVQLLSDQAANDRVDKAASRELEKERLTLDSVIEVRREKETEARLKREEARDAAAAEQQRLFMNFVQKTLASSIKDQLLEIKGLLDGELITADEATALRSKILAMARPAQGRAPRTRDGGADCRPARRATAAPTAAATGDPPSLQI